MPRSALEETGGTVMLIPVKRDSPDAILFSGVVPVVSLLALSCQLAGPAQNTLPLILGRLSNMRTLHPETLHFLFVIMKTQHPRLI